MTPDKENRRGCYAFAAILAVVIAIALWMALGTESLRDPPAGVAAPGDPTTG